MSNEKTLAEIEAELDAALLGGRPTDRIQAARETALYKRDEAQRIQRQAEAEAAAQLEADIDASARELADVTYSRIASVLEEPGQPPIPVTDDAGLVLAAARGLAAAEHAIQQANVAMIPLVDKAAAANKAVATKQALGSARSDEIAAGGPHQPHHDRILSDAITRLEALAGAAQAELNDAKKQLTGMEAARRLANAELSRAEDQVVAAMLVAAATDLDIRLSDRVRKLNAICKRQSRRPSWIGSHDLRTMLRRLEIENPQAADLLNPASLRNLHRRVA